MTDMPERIWADSSTSIDADGRWWAQYELLAQEYIRADKCAEYVKQHIRERSDLLKGRTIYEEPLTDDADDWDVQP